MTDSDYVKCCIGAENQVSTGFNKNFCKGETSGVKKDFVCMDEEYERVDDLNKESTVNDEIIEADENDEDDDVMKEKAKGNFDTAYSKHYFYIFTVLSLDFLYYFLLCFFSCVSTSKF